MKNKNIVIGIIILILIGLIIFLVKDNQVKYFKKVTLSSNNTITNKTDKKYLDTLISKGLDVLDLKDKYVILSPLNPELKNKLDPDTELRAHIIGTQKQFVIYIGEMTREESITIISHELIHLHQYSTKKIFKLDKTTINYDGQVYNVPDIPYKSRPWEIEAFKRQGAIESYFRKTLYDDK